MIVLGLSDDEWFEWSDFDDSDLEEYEFDEGIPDELPEDKHEEELKDDLEELTEKRRKGNQTVSVRSRIQ